MIHIKIFDKFQNINKKRKGNKPDDSIAIGDSLELGA